MQSCNNPRQNSCRRDTECMEMPMMKPVKPCGMPSLAMSYVPWQQWGNLYQADEGYHQGTIFKDLNMPFTGKGMC